VERSDLQMSIEYADAIQLRRKALLIWDMQ